MGGGCVWLRCTAREGSGELGGCAESRRAPAGMTACETSRSIPWSSTWGACVSDVKTLAKALPCLWPVRRRRRSWAPLTFLETSSWRSCGGRHALRLLLLMKSELLADGVWRCLATMTSCSLFQGVGAGRVKEVSLWWLG
uniref:Uncharacterized protein n=1 Tax=Oryza sativa subsp. japonica TaxID=39947 RepID=Q2QWW8_ORYSJ|nr:hypothetical protein LOC_Os12g07960 [Oryza sativa Japonica Group]